MLSLSIQQLSVPFLALVTEHASGVPLRWFCTPVCRVGNGEAHKLRRRMLALLASVFSTLE